MAFIYLNFFQGWSLVELSKTVVVVVVSHLTTEAKKRCFQTIFHTSLAVWLQERIRIGVASCSYIFIGSANFDNFKEEIKKSKGWPFLWYHTFVWPLLYNLEAASGLMGLPLRGCCSALILYGFSHNRLEIDHAAAGGGQYNVPLQ